MFEENGVYNFYLREEFIEEGVAAPSTPDGVPRPRTPDREQQDVVLRTWQVGEGERPASTRSRTPRAGRRRPVRALGAAQGEPDCEEAELHEARPARPGWTPDTPSEAEKKERDVSGRAVFRNWCPECIQATGRVQQHRRVPREDEHGSTVVMDYFYLNEEEPGRTLLLRIARLA